MKGEIGSGLRAIGNRLLIIRDRLLRMSRKKLIALVSGIIVLGVVLGLGISILVWYQSNEPDTYDDIATHYKYGSFGGEADRLPYWIWRVLPDVFPKLLPDGPGDGYERFGFIDDTDAKDAPKDHPRPIGISYRAAPVPQMGFSCAACHSGTLRESPDAPRQIILGMPANQIDIWGLTLFWFAAANHDDFDADHLIPAIEEVNPNFSWLDKLFYRFVVIPQTKSRIKTQQRKLTPVFARDEWGYGRVDTFATHKYILFDLPDDTSGTVDFPSVWNQGPREGMWLHWDGNNNSVHARNLIAGISAGATVKSLDAAGLRRTEDWLSGLAPPEFPRERIDLSRYDSGRQIFQTACAECHEFGGERTGQVVPIDEIGTDPDRFNAYTQEIADRTNALGDGLICCHQKSIGYSSPPLDGIWLRAPYLHNGSVPTLRDLLKPPEDRPKVFYRGYDVYDFDNVGFITDGPEAESSGFKYDTSKTGNRNQGHVYGVGLSQREIDDLVEFLKTQ